MNMRTRAVIAWCIGLVVSLGVAPVAAGDSVPLIEAVKQGDLRGVRGLVSRDTVNMSEVDGSTALHWAAQRGAVEIVGVLLAAGAKVDVATRYGVTPLGLASTRGSAAIIERLLNAGADLDAPTSERGETPLMLAARMGDVASVELLLAHGADPNARERADRQTALMWAAAENNAETIEVLIRAGAEIGAMSGNEEASKEKAFIRMIRFARGTFRGFGDQEVRAFSALHFAVQRGNLEATRVLLDKGADIEQPTLPVRVHPLTLAIASGHYELAAYLLDRGADPDAMLNEPHGWTALHHVARMRAPIEQNVPFNKMTGTLGSLELAEKLIEHGANVNARMKVDSFPDGYRNRLDFTGATPFLVAAKATDPELMRLLIAHGADTNIATAGGTTPLMVAAGIGAFNPGEDFRTGPDGEPYALEAVQICLGHGADVNAVDEEGETAQHGAAYLGRNSVVELLVDRGAVLDPVNKVGWTPLRIADGVHYSGHQKHQRHTAVLLRQIMRERGMTVEDAVIENLAVPECSRGYNVCK